jgi:HMG-box domain
MTTITVADAKKLYDRMAPEGKKSIMSHLDELRQIDIEKDIKDDLAGYTPEQRAEFFALAKEGKKRGKGKKRERQPKVKDPNAPKGPTKAYFFFSKDKLAEIKAKDSTLEHKVAQKMCGDIWKKLSEEEKQPYLDQQAEDKVRYDKEMEGYDASAFDPTTVVKKVRVKKEKVQKEKPKKTKKEPKKEKEEEEEEEGFSAFSNRILPEIKKQNEDISDSDAKERCKTLWGTLSDEKKAYFAGGNDDEENEESSDESSE